MQTKLAPYIRQEIVSPEPPILQEPIWIEAKRYLVPQRNPHTVRAHFHFRNMPEHLAKRMSALEVPCIYCRLPMKPFRKHRNSDFVSMHVCGTEDLHSNCKRQGIARQAIAILQEDVGQASETQRVQKVRNDKRQPEFQMIDSELRLPKK